MIEIRLLINIRLLTNDTSIERWVRSKRNKIEEAKRNGIELIARGTSIPKSLQAISLIFNKTLTIVLDYKTCKALRIEHTNGEFNWYRLDYWYLYHLSPISQYTIKPICMS
jgi:hypothetical protein